MEVDSTKKYIILYNSLPYLLPFFNQKNIIASNVLRKRNVIEKILRKISIKLNLCQFYWFADWKKHLKEVDTVIIFAPLRELDVLKLIRKKNPKARIIYWYWNPLKGVKKINPKYLEGIEVWSFDPKDCDQYNFKFNTTFYFKEIKLPKNKIIYDSFFIGKDKGRRKQLIDLELILKNKGLNLFFNIIGDLADDQDNIMPYDDYLEKVSESKTIIDFTPKGQSGLTVRTMESIFFKKKLITYDENIINQDFYCPQNVFIIGKDNMDNIKQFIDTPYKDLDERIVSNYDFTQWLKRFN